MDCKLKYFHVKMAAVLMLSFHVIIDYALWSECSDVSWLLFHITLLQEKLWLENSFVFNFLKETCS